MRDGVVQRACRAVVLLSKPVDAGGAEPISECKDRLDKSACDVPAALQVCD
jgi:hypothetical protein